MLNWRLWGHQKVPWGYEVRIDAWDEAGQHYPLCMTWFSSDPDKQTVDTEAARRLAHLQAELLEPVPEPETVYTEAEVLKILVEKGYLGPGQRLSDLPQKGAV
jgi:hypothetical protein